MMGLPAAALLGNIFWGRYRKIGKRPQMPLAFWSALVALGMFVCSIVSAIVLSRFESLRLHGFLYEQLSALVLGWPFIGMAASVLGFSLLFFEPRGERWKLAVVNLLILLLAVVTIVPVN